MRYCLILFLVVFMLPVFAEQPDSVMGASRMGQMDPAMHQRMMALIQDMLVMSQNTAVETRDGFLVLQGNRLLDYSRDLQLRRTVTLPVPAIATAEMGNTPTPSATAPQIAIRGMVIAKLLPQDNGDLVIVRGQQILRFDRNLRLVNQAMLPDLPPLTPAEIAAVAPMAIMIQFMPMMGGGMSMGGTMPTQPAMPGEHQGHEGM